MCFLSVWVCMCEKNTYVCACGGWYIDAIQKMGAFAAGLRKEVTDRGLDALAVAGCGPLLTFLTLESE